jgi:hypothetical protein
MVIELIKSILDKIPYAIGLVRSTVIKGLEAANLPAESTWMIIAAALSLGLAYYWLKSYVTYNILFKMSTLLNWILLSLVIYLVFTYV